jgi:hypothetical protein
LASVVELPGKPLIVTALIPAPADVRTLPEMV